MPKSYDSVQPPSAGELRTLITIRRWQDMPNAEHGIDQTFAAPVNTMAKKQPVGAQIYYGTAQTETAVTDRFIIRNIEAAINGNHVIDCGGERFRIQRVAPLGDGGRFVIIDTEKLGKLA